MRVWHGSSGVCAIEVVARLLVQSMAGLWGGRRLQGAAMRDIAMLQGSA